MNCRKLKVVNEEKDLRVVFADNLNPSGQCFAAYKKATRMIGIIWGTIA